MKIIKSVKPSGTYVKVRLLRPWCAGKGHPVRMPGEVLVCDSKLADHLALQMIGAVMFEAPRPPVVISVPGTVN